MAFLIREDGSVAERLGEILAEMSLLGVRLGVWPIDAGSDAIRLLEQAQLDAPDREALLCAFDVRYNMLKREMGIQGRDLVVMHPGMMNLVGIMAAFTRCHTHSDNEIRYVVDGEGVFGFVLTDGRQVELVVEAGEYAIVPAGVEHWFRLTARKRIKAIRYFSGTEGWAATYTDTPIRFALQS